MAALRAQGVDTRHIQRTAHGRLGLYFVEAGVNQRPGQVIYDRENSACAMRPAAAYDWPKIFHGADWLVSSGITPALTRTTAELANPPTAIGFATAAGCLAHSIEGSSISRPAMKLKP